jgi:hypothetical protein
MSNRRTHLLASIVVVCMAGFYSQVIAVSSQAVRSISSRVPSDPDAEEQTAAVDDADDEADDSVSLHCTLSLWPSGAAVAPSHREETINCLLNHLAGATLVSQHTLLRL